MKTKENEQGGLPDKVTRIDVLRVERGLRKQCICPRPHYSVDSQNRLVYCEECGAIVDPFDALFKMANRYEALGEQVEFLLEQRRQIDNYKPRLVVIKRLEQRYREQKYSMLPTCPHCKTALDLAELLNVSWLNRCFADSKEQKESKEDIYHGNND